MSDIKAISQMRARKKCHEDFKIPTKSDQFDTFQEGIVEATKATADVIQQVNNYVTRIKKEMRDLRITIEEFKADLAERMKTLISKLTPTPPDSSNIQSGDTLANPYPGDRSGSKPQLNEGTKGTSSSSRPSHNVPTHMHETSSESDRDNLRQIAELQKISDQQQELRKMMVKVEGITKELENEGKMSVNELIALKQDVDQWAHNLESADVEYARKKKKEREEEERKKRQREEENRKKAVEDEKRRKQREEERKQKAMEEEKQKKEDERKRKEMEKKKKEDEERQRKEMEAKKMEDEERRRKEREEAERRKDWRNWPPLIFHRDDDNTAFHKGISCIVLAIEGGLSKEDLTSNTSDVNKDREKCLQSDKKEIPVSSLVTIKPSTMSVLRQQEPVRVFIPYQHNQSSRDIVVKVSIDGGPWESMKHEAGIPPNVNIKDVHMVQIAVNNFKSVGILVASRPKFQSFFVGKEGKTVEMESHKARFNIPENCFPEKTEGTFQVTDKKHAINMAKGVKDLRNAELALATYNITFDKSSQSKITLEVYLDLKPIIRRPQSAFKTCEKKMIKEMDVETVAQMLYQKGIISSTTLHEIGLKKSKEEKVKALIQDMLHCEENEFQQLIKSLEESNQQDLANVLKKALADVETTEMGSDFVDENEDKVAMLTSKNGQGWSIVDFEKVKEVPGACLLQLPTGGKTFSVIGLVVPKSLKDSELSRLAEMFYVSSEQFRMRLLVKQHKEDKHRLSIRCVNPEMFSDTSSEMQSLGFTYGPSESFEFSVNEGETLWMQLMGDWKFPSQQSSEIHFKVYTSAVYTMEIRISAAKGRNSSSKFKNDLQYNIGLIEQKPPRHGVFKLQL